MSELTDKIEGRAKQAAGSITGDDETKRDGERQEHKGEVKGKVNNAVDGVKDGLDDLKDKVDRQ